MLKSIKITALGLFATSLTLSVISPSGAVVSTTKSEAEVTENKNTTLVVQRYRDYRRDGRYRRRRSRRYRKYSRYPYYGRSGRRYRRSRRRFRRNRRCFYRIRYNRYGGRYRVRVCPYYRR